MSWGQGFFRAWVLLSSIWIAIIVLLAYEGIINPRFEERAYVFRKGAEAPDIIDRADFEYSTFEQGVISGDLQKIEIPDVPRIYLFTRKTTPLERVNKRIEEVKPKAAALRSQLVSDMRGEALLHALSLASIPPLVFLILGFAIAWVLAGFRRPSAR